MKLINTRCALCNSQEDYSVLYRSNFDENDLTAEIFSARRMPDRIHYRIVKCNKDDLVRSNPIIDASRLHALYEKSKFTYEDEIGNLTMTYLNVLEPVLRALPKDAKILEVGCGNGFMLRALCGKGYKNVFGVEPSSNAAQKADRLIQKKIICGMLRSDSFASHTFDLIFFFQTFDHIQDPNNFLKICNNLLLPGRFIVAFNHDVESVQSLLLKEKSPIIDVEHPYFYSKITIKKIFEKNNFKIIKLFNPHNFVSLRHLLWLLPVPGTIKKKITCLTKGFLYSILKQKIKAKLGNLCLVAKKCSA